MPFSKISIDKRRRTFVRLIGDIHNKLNQALAEEYERRQLTRTEMADMLGTNKSFVTRKLNGTSNMTLETLADLAFALDRVVKVQLISRTSSETSNQQPYMEAQSNGQLILGLKTSSASSSTTASTFAIKKKDLEFV